MGVEAVDIRRENGVGEGEWGFLIYLLGPATSLIKNNFGVNYIYQSFCFIVLYRFPQNFIANKCSQVLASPMYLPPFPNS